MSEETSSASGTQASSKPSGSGVWDKIPAVLAALNPVLLIALGYILNSRLERAKLAIEQTKVQIEENGAKLQDLETAAETATIAVHDRVDKVKVISDFLNDLSGPDERRRSLAIEAIFIALPPKRIGSSKWQRSLPKSVATLSADNKDVAAAKDALWLLRNPTGLAYPQALVICLASRATASCTAPAILSRCGVKSPRARTQSASLHAFSRGGIVAQQAVIAHP